MGWAWRGADGSRQWRDTQRRGEGGPHSVVSYCRYRAAVVHVAPNGAAAGSSSTGVCAGSHGVAVDGGRVGAVARCTTGVCCAAGRRAVGRIAVLAGGVAHRTGRGGSIGGVGLGLDADGDVGLVPLRVVGVLVVGHGLWLHVLGTRMRHVAIVVVHHGVGVQHGVRPLVARGSVVGPHHGVKESCL